MPIVERDAWRDQYFAGIDCPDDVAVATDDADAFAWNPRFRHIYDKLHVARSQNLRCGDAANQPVDFPVFVKPRFNMRGMSVASGPTRDQTEFAALAGPETMWAEVLTGAHLSSDFAVEEGRVRWVTHALGHPRAGGMFWHWDVGVEAPDGLETSLADWIGREARGYSGMLNVETLGGRIIEAHLRFADQWPDLMGGRPWVEAVVGLASGRGWCFSVPPRRGHSVPLFVPHRGRYRHPPASLQARVRAIDGVSSLQVTFHEDRAPEAHPMPPGGFRVAIVNGFDLASCYRARDLLWSAWFARPEARAD